MRIKRSADGVILFLNKDLYEKDAIGAAIRDFSSVCEIGREEEGRHHTVRFHGLAPDELEEVALEFSNHALSNMKA